MIPMVKQKQEPDSMRDPNMTESWIRFTPNPSNHMQVELVIYCSLSCQLLLKVITCRAVNYKLHGVNNIKEDHRVLAVFCKYIFI